MSEETQTLRVVSTGPFKNLSFPGHASAEDFDRDAGKTGDCVEEADASVAYRSTLPTFHDDFTKTLETMSGMSRPVNEKATAKAKENAKDPSKVKDVPASFIDFANAVKASVDEETWKSIDAAARNLALQTRIDASPSTRVGAVSAELKSKADSWLNAGPDVYNAKITQFAEQYGLDPSVIERDEAGTPDRDSLARYIKQIFAAKMREEL